MKESAMRIIWVISLIGFACDAKEASDDVAPATEEARWEGQYPGECADEADNDGDGLFDCDDSDCEGAPNCNEESADLDLDGTTDADSDADEGMDDPEDTGDDEDAMGLSFDDYEGDTEGECGDGIDNDRDGVFDCLDPGCSTASECTGDDGADEGDTTEDGGGGGTDGEPDGPTADDGLTDEGEAPAGCESEDTGRVVGEGEMVVSGWITLTGDVDPLRDATSCRLTSWPHAALDEDGVPDLSSGTGMLGEACIDCPVVVDVPLPFSVILPVEADGEPVAFVAKVEVDRIYEVGCEENPVDSVSAGSVTGLSFTVEVAEPGPGDPGGGTPLDAGDPLDGAPPEAPPDLDGTLPDGGGPPGGGGTPVDDGTPPDEPPAGDGGAPVDGGAPPDDPPPGDGGTPVDGGLPADDPPPGDGGEPSDAGPPDEGGM